MTPADLRALAARVEALAGRYNDRIIESDGRVTILGESAADRLAADLAALLRETAAEVDARDDPA